MRLYSEGYFNEIKKIGLMCKKKEELSEAWQQAMKKFSEDKAYLICTDEDLKSSKAELSVEGAPIVSLSKAAVMKTSAFTKKLVRFANLSNVYIGRTKESKEEPWNKALIAKYKNQSWYMTSTEYQNFKTSYLDNPNNADYPVMTVNEDKYFETLVRILPKN